MLLAVKIGNSTLNFAFFQNPYNSNFTYMSFNVQEELNWERIRKYLKFSKKVDCVVCSVVPKLTEKFVEILKDICLKLLIIDYKTNTGLILRLNSPETFGSDRLCSAVAAHELLKENLAVVDTGTATTITIVTQEGEILGGSIMPGINMMNYALSEKTASLPFIDLKGAIFALGIDTHSAIRGGIVLGTVYAIEGIIKKIEEEINRNLVIILTGGSCDLVSKYMTRDYLLNRYLVIEGMRLIYLKNKKN